MAAPTFRAERIAGQVDLLALHRADPDRHPVLLASTASGDRARWSLLLSDPGATLRAEPAQDFLDRLDADWQAERTPEPATELPFTGGWFVYLGYELAGAIEPRLRLPHAEDGLPLALATRMHAAVIVDHQQQATWLVAEEPGADARLAGLRFALAAGHARPEAGAALACGPIDEAPARDYELGVVRILDYIRAGDVFQVNLSRPWRARLSDGAAADVFARLAQSNPAPYAALAVIGTAQVISSSPERLVRVGGGLVETRPIAGTRPRGADAGADAALRAELAAHPKERAEHVMLLDLERNDLGRVCAYGTVEVNERMVLESYAHVHHIVSNVRGRLRDDWTPGRVIRAVFPGGTITGCPKVRCMEIIAELEHSGRGAYTGSLGYLNRDGRMDLNILIRTMTLHDGELRWRAGAGIVADSDPAREVEETRAKARGLCRAVADEASR